jgi:hypothetical protein
MTCLEVSKTTKQILMRVILLEWFKRKVYFKLKLVFFFMNQESKYVIQFRYAYTYERQDIIQIALKSLPGGGECSKKNVCQI